MIEGGDTRLTRASHPVNRVPAAVMAIQKILRPSCVPRESSVEPVSGRFEVMVLRCRASVGQRIGPVAVGGRKEADGREIRTNWSLSVCGTAPGPGSIPRWGGGAHLTAPAGFGRRWWDEPLPDPVRPCARRSRPPSLPRPLSAVDTRTNRSASNSAGCCRWSPPALALDPPRDRR